MYMDVLSKWFIYSYIYPIKGFQNRLCCYLFVSDDDVHCPRKAV